MCWSVPGKIIEMKDNIAQVEISGVCRDVAVDLITNPEVGDYVLVHAGYAIQKVNAEDAKFTLEFFKNKGDLTEK